MKNDMLNYAPRLEDMLFQIRKKNEDLAFAVEKLMADTGLDYLICGEQNLNEGDGNEFELDISGGNADLELYCRISRSIRLLSLAGQKPQEFMSEEADFLFGCPMRYEDFSDDDIEAIRFDPNVEATDNRTFYYVWLYIGEFEEIKMAAKIDSERGTVHPLSFIPVKSKYDLNSHADNKPLTAEERKTMIDRIFYASLIPDEITDDNDEYSEWSEDIEDDEEDEVEWMYPDEEEEEWTEDIDEEETDDKEEIDSEDSERMRMFGETMRDIRVLSVTDLIGNDKETMFFSNLYANMKNFVGKIDKISIGERMYIFHPKPKLNPYCPDVRIHTSTVMFHSEELISENEIKHIVRTVNSIYTFIEYKKQH